MKHVMYLVAAPIAALLLAVPAYADPPAPHQGDPNLCSSNPAYHNAHDRGEKQAHCQDAKLNDFGGGGAPDADRDGDGTLNRDDENAGAPG